MSHIQIINPITYPGWDDLVLSTEEYSFFHSSSWARVLSESYGYKPLYFAVIDNNRLSASIPIMEIKSILTGRRGVSLPFSDYCEPITADKTQFEALFNYVTNYGTKYGWKYLELRGGKRFFQDISPSSYYYSHILDLKQNEAKIFARFRDSTTRNIKKAIGAGVEAKICNDWNSIKEFYRLHCMTKKYYGLPPQPFYFFKKVYDHIVSKNRGIVVLASHNKDVIAGAVFFHFEKKGIYKYGASDRSHLRLRPNNLVMWEAIKWYCQHDFETFCFGRSEPTNNGLIQFKKGWGTIRKSITYYKYDIRKRVFQQYDLRSQRSFKFLDKVPTPLLNFAASLFYRHVG